MQTHTFLTLLHSERPKIHGVLAVLSAIGLKYLCCKHNSFTKKFIDYKYILLLFYLLYFYGEVRRGTVLLMKTLS